MTRISRSGGGQGWLDIHEDEVRAFIRDGGEVAELLNAIAQETEAYGRAYISKGHMRSGRLLRGLYNNRVKPEGPLTAFSRAGGRARHTIYFHEGTTNPTAKGPLGFLIIPRSRRAANTITAFKGAGTERLAQYKSGAEKTKGVIGRKSVRGQRSKPFLKEGLAVAMANHGLK